MQINLSARHLDLTDALREHATGKMKKLEHHFERVISVDVVLQVEKNRHLAEANVHVGHNVIHANAEAENMYAAVDSLVLKLDRQCRKHRGKRTDHHPHQHRDGELPPSPE